MSKEQQQEIIEVPTAWVKCEIHDLCRQNAHAIKEQAGLRIEDVYRFALHFVLYHESSEDAIAFFNHILNPGGSDANQQAN